MKWFKHQSDMVDDPKMRRLIRKHGAEAYAVYNLVIERIVKRLDSESPIPDLEETAEDIADMLRMDTVKVEEIMWTGISLGLFEQDEVSGRILAMKVYKFILKSETRSDEIRAMIERFQASGTVTDNRGHRETILIDREGDTDKEEDTEKIQKDPHGVTGFVELTKAEHDKLCEKFGPDNVDVLIASLENYSKRDKYKSHYKTLLQWGQRDNMKPPAPEPSVREFVPDVPKELLIERHRRLYGDDYVRQRHGA